MRFTKRFFDIQSDRRNYSFQRDFEQGFIDAAPDCYNFELDTEFSDPFCWPFTVDPYLVIEGSTAYDAGFQYAKSIYSELLEYWQQSEEQKYGIYSFNLLYLQIFEKRNLKQQQKNIKTINPKKIDRLFFRLAKRCKFATQPNLGA